MKASPSSLINTLLWCCLFNLLLLNTVQAAAPSLTTPLVNSSFTGSSQTFTWSDGGTAVSNWRLSIGSTQGGSDYFQTAILTRTTNSITANNLPSNAHKAYVRLAYKLGRVWKNLDYTYYLTGQNHAPDLTGATLSTATLGKVYVFTPKITEMDGEKLSFSIANKPSWAVFSHTTGRLRGTPTTIGTTNITISVKDERGATDSLSFNLQVVPVNRAPVIGGKPSLSVNVGENYSFTPTVSDTDGDILSFSINARKPSWATFNSTTGALTGIPSTAHLGLNRDIVISVTDGKSTVSLPPFTISVKSPLNLANLFGLATQGEDYSSSYPAKAAIDNSLSSFNHTSCDARHNWWQVKLPDPTQVSALAITSRGTGESQLKDATVYVTNTAYNGSLSTADQVGTPLLATTSVQRITLATPKTGRYVIIKANGANCLHMAEVVVNGQAPATPVFTQANYSFLLSPNTPQGQLITQIKATDYQLEPLTYKLDGAAPFSIDNQGKLAVNGLLAAGTTYSFQVTASDGVNIGRAPVTVRITASTAVEDALRTGDARLATTEALLDATLTELGRKKTPPSLWAALYGAQAIHYTPGNSTQLLEISQWAESSFPILIGANGNTLAMAGTTTNSRYAAFGVAPTDLFKAGQNLGFETPFKRLLAWLVAGEPLNTTVLENKQTVGLSMVNTDSATHLKTWITQNYPQLTLIDCNTVTALDNCYSKVALIVTDGGSNQATDAAPVKQALTKALALSKPVLYLHTRTWGSNEVNQAIAQLMQFSLPYGGNWWANDAANWMSTAEMQTAAWEKQGLGGIEKILKHFKYGDYSMTGLETEFHLGAKKIRSTFMDLDQNKINLFANEGSRLYRLLALLGDNYRQKVTFPMDQNATNANTFLKSLFADHAVYNYRPLNPAQPDLGNFSRSNFSHITPITKTVQLTSREHFRAAGVYALPGRTFRVTRNDNSNTATAIFINTLREHSTHELEAWGYKRPKFLQSAHIPLQSGATLTLTSPYGGPIQIEFSANDQPVSLTFEQVGEHPFWDDASDNTRFAAQLAAGEYDWAEFVTPAFEVHSTLEKMRESVSDTRWGGTEGFAAATMRYTHNFPHVLAGFKGPKIDVVAEIHDFASTHGYQIDNLDLVKHMNADQATCGYGCSGNPYDAYWAFSPIAHGDIHELGHGLEKERFSFSGWEMHSITNPYSYYSKTQYYKATGAEPDCQELPFEAVFNTLQASRKQPDPVAYLQTQLWANSDWSQQVSMTIQMMMAAQNQGALLDGWHLLARLHILEREFNRALANETTWEAKKISLGFSNYTFTEAQAISNNDWLVIALSYVTGLDYRHYIRLWGQTFTTKADAQVAGFGYAAVAAQFFVSSATGYCKGGGFNGQKLPLDGTSQWITPLR